MSLSTIEKLYSSPLARVRAIRNRHRFSLYTSFILNDLKRNGRISIESKRYLIKLELVSAIIELEYKLYGVQL